MYPPADRPGHTAALVVSLADEGRRLDLFVTRHLPTLSRAHVQRLIRQGAITVNGHADKASALVVAGARVAVSIPELAADEPTPEALPLTLVYDDEDLAVVDKPAGMVVHPAAGHAQGTLVNALLHHVGGLSGIGGRARPGIVHRLDKGTSGLMVIAKHDQAHQALSRQFHDRHVQKEYEALVWGHPPTGLVLDTPIGRDPRDRKKMSSRAPRARPAITTVTTVEELHRVSLIRVTIGTGRTHQIRVHLSEAGYPVVGDELYGGVRKRLPLELGTLDALGRPFLHAALLAFAHPRDERWLSFEAPMPPELLNALGALRRATAPRPHSAEGNS
jgi:23S rRNA pseudouridine1911/1915/1917 synthase